MLSPCSDGSPVRKELDFQPQLWLTENTSGALLNRVMLEPVAPVQAIVKYALTADRGSRYDWGGETGRAVAGMVTLAWLEDEPSVEYEEGRDDDMAGVDGVE